MKKFLNLLLIFTLFAIVACGGKNTTTTQEKKLVITSNYPIYYFTKTIAGDAIDVENLIPTGAEPHDWEPSSDDIIKLEKANAFIYNGAGMEPWADDILKGLKNKDLATLIASDKIVLIKNEEHEEEHHHDHDHDGHDHHHHHEGEHEHDHEHEHHHHHHGEFDPHVWLSLKNAQIEITNIKELLTKISPENKEVFEKNYEKAINDFKALDEKFTNELKEFAGKEIVVSHEAFAYLCRDYGLKQLGIEGVFADSEPSPAKMKEIIDFVKEHNVKVIFFESLASPKVAEAIAKETGAKTDMLNPIEGLTEEDVKNNEDYLSLMNKNLEALKNALK